VLGGSVAPLRGFDDAGSVVVFQDLTELRRLQDDITRAERLAQLGRMAAGLAHEIRNPLAAMTGCLQLLAADEDFRGENKKLLGIVHRETERLGGLVHDFLTYARPAEPAFQRLLFNQTVEQTATAIRHGLKNATLEVGSLPALEVEVDEGQLRQVVWNIIANADRMVEGLVAPQTIRITGGVEAGHAVLMVDDSGPGVPEEIRAQIFEPFFTTRPDGNGLGLATCQQLIRQNRGTISVGTAPGLGGARFTIRLPKVA